jgi:hypothetical protein
MRYGQNRNLRTKIRGRDIESATKSSPWIAFISYSSSNPAESAGSSGLDVGRGFRAPAVQAFISGICAVMKPLAAERAMEAATRDTRPGEPAEPHDFGTSVGVGWYKVAPMVGPTMAPMALAMDQPTILREQISLRRLTTSAYRLPRGSAVPCLVLQYRARFVTT